MSEQVKAEAWAIVELMGHVRLAGRVSEEEHYGAKMGRLDIPTSEKCNCPNAAATSIETPRVPCDRCDSSGLVAGFVTQFFGGGSVYRITHVSEEVARSVAIQSKPAPVHSWEFPRPALPSARSDDVIDADFEVTDDDDGRDLP